MRNILLVCLFVGTSAAYADCGVGYPAFTGDSYRLMVFVPEDVQQALKEKIYLQFAMREVSTRSAMEWQMPSGEELRAALNAKDAALQAAIANGRSIEDARILSQHLVQINRQLLRTIRWGVSSCGN